MSVRVPQAVHHLEEEMTSIQHASSSFSSLQSKGSKREKKKESTHLLRQTVWCFLFFFLLFFVKLMSGREEFVDISTRTRVGGVNGIASVRATAYFVQRICRLLFPILLSLSLPKKERKKKGIIYALRSLLFIMLHFYLLPLPCKWRGKNGGGGGSRERERERRLSQAVDTLSFCPLLASA